MSCENKEIESLNKIIESKDNEIKALKAMISLKEAHIECLKSMHMAEIATIKHAKVLNSKETDFDKNLKKEGEILRDGEYLISRDNGLRVTPSFKSCGYVQDDTDFSCGGVVTPAEHYYFTNGKHVPVNGIDDALKIKEKDDKINKNED